MKLLRHNFNETFTDCDNDNYTRQPMQLDMFKKYTMAVILSRDEADFDWWDNDSATVFIGTDRWRVEDRFTYGLQDHPTNVGRFLLVEKPLYKLYNKEW